MTPQPVERHNLLKNASEFFAGAAPNLEQSVIFRPLECGTIDAPCSHDTASHIADVQINIGTYALTDEEYHAAVALRVVIPTGTRPNAALLFEPVIGNGHHWELGANGNIYVLVWKNESETKKLTGHAIANLTYMFKTTQTRCFDLFDKPNSRYMLVERLASSPREQPQLAGNSNVGTEFQNELSPLANITMANVFVGSTFQADAIFAISFHARNFAFDFGYNYWYRGNEQVRLRDRCQPPGLDGNSWAPKGDAYVYGFADQPTTTRLAATESGATIRSGTNNYPYGVDGISSFQNGGIDSPVEAKASLDGGPEIDVTAINGKAMFTSERPYFLNINSIDLSGSAGYSDKLFTHLSYTWHYNETYTFFLRRWWRI